VFDTIGCSTIAGDNMRLSKVLAVLLAFAVAASAGAQPMAPATWKSITSTAQQQIREAQQATKRYASLDSARADGFGPVFGWIPTMGTHWVSGQRMLAGKGFTLASPSQLMFSRVNGKETLVGAAYAYVTPVSDSVRPPSFDGNPPWHEHPDLAPPGTTLVMLHVWFVPSPDGPFAGHNPYLPFWALGLTPPDEDRMTDEAESARVRKAALGLGEVADTNGLFRGLARRPAVRPVLDERRAAIRALVPQLDSAQRASDWKRWDAVADQIGSHWQAIREAYLASAVNPLVHARIEKLLDEMLSGAHAGHVH